MFISVSDMMRCPDRRGRWGANDMIMINSVVVASRRGRIIQSGRLQCDESKNPKQPRCTVCLH